MEGRLGEKRQAHLPVAESSKIQDSRSRGATWGAPAAGTQPGIRFLNRVPVARLCPKLFEPCR